MTEKRTEGLTKWDQEYFVHGTFPLGRGEGQIIESGEGIFIQDVAGKRYGDAASQLVCANLGYSYQQEVVGTVYQP